jgi:glycerol-3-phosphate cytidylyltransferase-like family protein
MKKIAFTFGDFDCFNDSHLNLIKEMRKIVVPEKEVIVVLIDDYASFVNNRTFPVQDLHRRADNLAYFVKDVVFCYSEDPTGTFGNLLERIKSAGANPVYVGYDDNKDFKGREVLKSYGVPIKFIKKSNEKT